LPLAPFACHPAFSRGRRFPEPPSRLRDAFARDRDRVIHSTAFRRLRDKTQVFVAPEGDHFRVRLTHSLEVAQIARTIARVLQLNEDLAEVLALAHDIGHPPFGHSGEEALAAALAPWGGFDHNGQAVRLLTALEYRTPVFPGLNLSFEVLEGVAKHNGPVASPGWALATADAEWPLELDTHAALEAQVAGLADDIAYNAHDLDDGMRAGLFTIEEAAETVPMVDAAWRAVRDSFPDQRDPARLVPQLVRDLIGEMVDSLVAETRGRLRALNPEFPDDIRRAGAPVAAFAPALQADLAPLRAFLWRRMYDSPEVRAFRDPAVRVVRELFAALADRPEELPERWRARGQAADPTWRMRTLADYVAGMTDRFAIREHRRLAGTSPMPDEGLF